MKTKVGVVRLIVLSILVVVVSSMAESLYVYYPSTVKSNVVQMGIQGAAGDVTVVVFGKYRDFVTKASADNPTAVMIRGESLNDLTGYNVVSNASRSGARGEKYVLLSIDTPVDLTSLSAETVVGVVDINRRNEMNTFVSGLLGVSPSVKHVTKVEDLLPLLSFGMAQAVIVTESDVAYFSGVSNLNLVTTPISSSSEIAVIATNSSASNAVNVAKQIATVTPDYMGGVQWEN